MLTYLWGFTTHQTGRITPGRWRTQFGQRRPSAFIPKINSQRVGPNMPPAKVFSQEIFLAILLQSTPPPQISPWPVEAHTAGACGEPGGGVGTKGWFGHLRASFLYVQIQFFWSVKRDGESRENGHCLHSFCSPQQWLVLLAPSPCGASGSALWDTVQGDETEVWKHLEWIPP